MLAETVVIGYGSACLLYTSDKGLASYAEKGIKAHGYVCDVTDEPAVQAMVATIAKEVGTTVSYTHLEIVYFQVGNRCYTSLSKIGVGFFQPGFTNHGDFTFMSHFQCEAHSGES